MLTGHGDGSGSGLPPLRPLVLSPRRCRPRPLFLNVTKFALSAPPPHSRAPTPIGPEEARGATGHAGAGAAEGRRLAGGARGAGGGAWRRGAEPVLAKVGRVTWAGGGAGVRLAMWRSRGAEHVTGPGDLTQGPVKVLESSP